MADKPCSPESHSATTKPDDVSPSPEVSAPLGPAKPIHHRPVRIAMIAGEVSGDILGAGLMQALQARLPKAQFEGIGGPLMLEQGFKTHAPMERLSVMGLVEVLGRLFELIRLRRGLRRYFLAQHPDIFIGIDAPDFNLGLERQLRQMGIKTAHYVSPSVWAWRQKRVFKIAKAVDLMLTLLPFEARFYQKHHIQVEFVGHPLANAIPMVTDQRAAWQTLGLSEGKYLAILPGSRGGEIAYLAHSFIATARWLHKRRPELRFLLPCVNAQRRAQIETIVAQCGQDLPITLIDGQSREVMAASDVVLLASGTATLEAMLLKKPMVVAYRVAPLTHRIMKRLLKAPFIALPNLLAGREVVPEFIQDAVQPDLLGPAILRRFHPDTAQEIKSVFSDLHGVLKRDASERAADAIVRLMERDDATPRQ